MCGLWGLTIKSNAGFTKSELDLASQMMQLTALRGAMATGLFLVTNDKINETPDIYKDIWDPYLFLLNPKKKDPIWNLAEKSGVALVGHGRAPTRGANTAKNAHPFVKNNITLVHNGTLYYSADNHDKEVEVDSHALTIQVAKNGVKKALEEAVGAFAIIAHDKAAGCIWIARNSQRELYYKESYNGGIRFIMSEKEALEYLLKRNKIPSDGIKIFEENKVYKINLQNNEMEVEGELIKTYKYQSKVYYPEHNKTFTNSNSFVRFKVLRKEVAANPKEFKWIASPFNKENKSEVFFLTTDTTDYTGKIGSAAIRSTISKVNKPLIYFVKHREITWETEEEDPKEENLSFLKESMLTLSDGQKISYKRWKNLTDTKTCDACLEKIPINSYSRCLLTKNNNLICPSCLSDVESYGYDPHSFFFDQ